MNKKHWIEWCWDAWCAFSIIGIWPRYIEPSLLEVNSFSILINHLPSQLNDLKILHFSDLHWNARFSSSLQKKLIVKINALQPDLILFTGDFLCKGRLEKGEELKLILNSLKAKWGCFAVLGNHDYNEFVTVNDKGDYDIENSSNATPISKGFKRLLYPVKLTKKVTERAKQVGNQQDLIQMLKQTPFRLLQNQTQLIACKGSWLNICGLEEYSLGKFNPKQAFQGYDQKYPGIVLSHNPDTIPSLLSYPGEVILSGHTHGGQVNLPLMWKRFTLMEHLQFKQGLKKLGEKWAYINRGIASVLKFRWFAAPELTLITLKKG